MTPEQVAALCDQARDQIGVKESGGPNSGVPAAKFAGGRREPWCGHFVAWNFRQQGADIPGDVEPTLTRANPLASTSHMERIFQEHEWYFSAGQPGDVIFYNDKGDRHCGIVVGATKDAYETVEGNWGDKVAHRVVLRSDPRIVGFGRRG